MRIDKNYPLIRIEPFEQVESDKLEVMKQYIEQNTLRQIERMQEYKKMIKDESDNILAEQTMENIEVFIDDAKIINNKNNFYLFIISFTAFFKLWQ